MRCRCSTASRWEIGGRLTHSISPSSSSGGLALPRSRRKCSAGSESAEGRRTPPARSSLEPERNRDIGFDVHRLAINGPGLERPLFHGVERRVIQGGYRFDDAYVLDTAICANR